MKIVKILLSLLVFSLLSQSIVAQSAPREIWSVEKANAWYKTKGWLRGSDFIPSTAINQLEMWQAESFDPTTIDRELGYAESIGMNSMRVYLHHLAWEVDPKGFKSRVNQYLTIANKHHISTLFVLFDDCWNPTYSAGKQPAPKPGVHNSGWVRDPGELIFNDPKVIEKLEAYVKDVLTTFKNDKRIVLWDLYNEPGNSGYGNKSMPLLEKVFIWGREANPSQPLSAGVWNWSLKELSDFQIKNSDVTTYHNYGDLQNHTDDIAKLRTLSKRPLLCTEYMARSRNSLFSSIMPLLKKENIAAYNWGLVAGKTNTIYAWDKPMPNGNEPELWFHDIFRPDGTAYKPEEVKVIKALTGKK
ncbi:glycoside hydrolase family 2 TIM barrel-domain containing protein [Arcicella aquatica]|uniref:Glycoside hydrolase family 2 TIM barrel-domain containing protein n=1 Tax=Arcicella aquatica TaxID=217141 RepID=A0ABU5QM86_9BACT|nr:glycoside hydrolase family 2 TIM barrel-domain containing protein [Arcicella aquatica]MEA5258182.1 glycoside hydrolase family 2 TIM barrel-domain containing protein [Arcicella aquatica]